MKFRTSVDEIKLQFSASSVTYPGRICREDEEEGEECDVTTKTDQVVGILKRNTENEEGNYNQTDQSDEEAEKESKWLVRMLGTI